MHDNIMTPNDDEISKLTEMLDIQDIDADIEFIDDDMVVDDDNDAESVTDYGDDEAIKIFAQHGAPVFGLDLNLRYNLVASGDQVDKALIWDFRTDQVFVEVHLADTVTQVEFSYDRKYLAIGDMAGNIVVYKINEIGNQQQNYTTSITPFIGITPANSHSNAPATVTATPPTAPTTSNGATTTHAPVNVTDEVYHEVSAMAGLQFEQVFKESIGDMEWTTWHFGVNVLFAGTKGTGEIYMWNIPTGECKIMPGVGCSSELGGVTEDGKKIVSVYENGMMKLWDAKSCQAVITHFNNDDTNLKKPRALAVSKDTPIFAAGDKEGKIFFYTYNGFVGQVQAEGSVECLQFPPVTCGLKVCISCTLKGQIAVWDYSRMQIRNTIENPENFPITSMVMMTDCFFAIGNVNGIIHIYDLRLVVPLDTMLGHLSTIYKMVYDANNKLIYSTSEDYSVRVFKPAVEITSVA